MIALYFLTVSWLIILGILCLRDFKSLRALDSKYHNDDVELTGYAKSSQLHKENK